MSLTIKFLKQTVRVTVRKKPQRRNINIKPRNSQGTIYFGSKSLDIHMADKVMTWADAVSYAQSLGPGWRLPKRDELDDLCLSEDGLLSLSRAALELFPDTTIDEEAGRPRFWFWSASPVSLNPQYVWLLFLAYGLTNYFDRTGRYGVLCVRS
jgi:hypothetical protein